MKWMLVKNQVEPGFRLNVLDLVYLAVVAGFSLGLYRVIPGSSLFWIPLYVVGTFFLFCNVFRIGGLLEPFWYLPFAAVTAYTLASRDLELFWLAVLFGLEPLKWALVGYRMVRGPYVGAGFEQVERWKNKAQS